MTKAQTLNHLIAERTREEEEKEGVLSPAPVQILTKQPSPRKYDKSYSKANGENLHIIGEKQKPMRLKGFEI